MVSLNKSTRKRMLACFLKIIISVPHAIEVEPAYCGATLRWLQPGNGARAGTTATVAAPVVTVVQVTRGEIVARVAVTGSLVAREEVLVNAQVSGYEIVSLAADVGDEVAEGEVLASLDTAALDASLGQARADIARVDATIAQAESQIRSATAQLSQAEGTLARATTLKTSGNTTQATLDQAQAAADTARAALASNEGGLAVARAQAVQAKVALDLATLNRERADIRAPVSGIVAQRNAKVGSIAAIGGTPLFTLLRGGEVELEAEVVETDLGSVSISDTATVDIAGIGKMDGVVRLLSPTVDPLTRLGTVRIALPPHAGLRPGLFGSGTIVTERRDGLRVPVAASSPTPREMWSRWWPTARSNGAW